MKIISYYLRVQNASEQFYVAKLAPTSSFKVLWPSSLEGLRVKLALRIFDKTNIAALIIHQSRRECVYNTQTGDCLSLICLVWKIFCVKTPMMGYWLNCDDS